MSSNLIYDAMEDRILAKTAVVGVVGLGFVGTPLLVSFGLAGFRVLGFDSNATRVAALQAGQSEFGHVRSSDVAGLRARSRLEATTEPRRLSEADAIIICVPTPLTPNREPDLSYITSAIDDVVRVARAGQLVILESTTYPGTTEEVLKPALGKTGLDFDREIFLAYSPEREDVSQSEVPRARIPKVVGGVTPASGRLAALLYESIVDRVVLVQDSRIAEASKLLENIFRCVNIALINELKICFDHMGIDVWQALDAASTKPFGYMRFEPGPGLGGHCIPIDPFYLTWKAREYGFATRFIELAGEINTAMPRWVVHKLSEALNDRCRSLKSADVLVLGVAYKKNIADTRESPAIAVLELLASKGARLSYHDPFVPSLRTEGRHPVVLESVALSEETLSAFDAVVIVTDHDAVDYPALARAARLVVDSRGALRKRAVAIPKDRIVEA